MGVSFFCFVGWWRVFVRWLGPLVLFFWFEELVRETGFGEMG